MPGLGLSTFWEVRRGFVKPSTYCAKHVARRGTGGGAEAGGRAAAEEQWLWFVVRSLVPRGQHCPVALLLHPARASNPLVGFASHH